MVLDNYGGLTGDPDTSVAEYGGLIGYALADTSEDSDPFFHDSDEQADGAPVVDGGWNQDSDYSVVEEWPGFTGDSDTSIPGFGNVPLKAVFGLMVVGAGLYLLGPVFGIVENLTEA